MEHSKHYDIAVVGYGPTGVTLANLLLKQGLSVLVIEREANILQLPRAIRFDAECMRVFQTIGITEQLLQEIAPGPGMKFQDASGELLITWERPVEKGNQQWSSAYRVHQPDLEKVLRDHIVDHPLLDLKLRHDVYKVDQSSEYCSIYYEDLSKGTLHQAQAKFVIGCDGARSLIRRLIGTTFDDLNLHSQWLVVDFIANEKENDLGDYSIQYCDPKRPMSYIKGTGQRRRWEIMVMPEDDLKNLTQDEKIWSLLESYIQPEQATIERAAIYTFHALLAKNWVKDRLIIAGDAAHQTPPFMGQGMAAGIRDAANLAWKLQQVIQDQQDISLIQSYFTERYSHASEFIQGAVQFGKIIQNYCEDIEFQVQTAKLKNFITPIPKLGAGFYCPEHHQAGFISPQFLVENQKLSDDLVGYQFSLVMRDTSILSSSELQHLQAEYAEQMTVLAPDAAISDWLQAEQAVAAIIRPDRYIFGFAQDRDSLIQLLEHAGIAMFAQV
ncbi:bifunctional 3-(3-hydroxy-phenyl)propionate/3-hydroxycinnamic acid hydroxylase [Acinetobacter stercoris]|uniref:3-(3-hydroxy-phenyl)propionate/3-hydroxycinnamic acid hydroxylase n=1 Tax=Acinetobacter stercoris TaxID=2126983 RepID=A0A2U3MZ81_9GAMM|nr:bifunctional 3-(3-hydroxy-phenyl)propionate/3-hydroxycinnamic acid hydroxylase [Acinetobacter stercoris]SPL70742.1 3-(3-hydroxy-phenyl)propionate/3-hydroxycinnamic acid hydroxylase [Acinetobacter stercoris]